MAPGVMKMRSAVLSGLVLAATWTMGCAALGQGTAPYTCEWISEVTPEAVIRFTSASGVGYDGNLFYRGKRVLRFQEGQYQGYGSHWWSSGEGDDNVKGVVVFRGNQVLRGTPGAPPQGPQRVLLVGLGSTLWYADQLQWRSQEPLLTAAEGFWRTASGCRTLS